MLGARLIYSAAREDRGSRHHFRFWLIADMGEGAVEVR